MTKKYSLFIGRFQPFHDGHKAIVTSLLQEGKNVLIAIRETEQSLKNPLSSYERYHSIFDFYREGIELGKINLIFIPDIEEVVYGRDVGYNIRQIRLDPELEAISGSKIRQQLQEQQNASDMDNG